MSLQHLDAEHLEPLKLALKNLLSTVNAEQTFAQIIDGMPIASVYAEDHWVHTPGLSGYQNGHVAWKLRLLELVVIACHEIAAYLYQLGKEVHKHAEWADWRSERLAGLPENAHGRNRTKCRPPTLFFAPLYKDPERFSNGLADVVAYWAESRVFGDVVLFDCGQPRKSSRPTTLAPPTEEQFNDLVDFLVSPSPDPAHCPLPIEITIENKWYWDPYRDMAEYHIYKYPQEILETRPCTHCVERPGDWPEVFDYQAAVAETRKNETGEPYDEGAWEKLARVITPTSIYWNVPGSEIYEELQPDERKRGRPP